MRFEKLESEKDLQQFRSSFLVTAKSNNLPLSYLQASMVMGIFNREDQMVAGYVLGIAQPLRLLEFVPESARASLVVPFQCQWSDCCEITCAWKLPEVSLLFMSARFWPHALIGVLKSGKKILLGHNQSARLDKFYTTLRPATIYEGISSFGLPSRLFAYRRSRVIMSILGLWIYETPRRFLKGEK